MADLTLWARYPFLPQARDFIRSESYDAGELTRDAAFERSRRRALERVRSALDRDGIPEVGTVTEADAEVELLSYPLARMILGHASSTYLNRRYAVAESKLCTARLSKEEDGQVVWRVATGLGVPLEPSGNDADFARVHFLDYLRYAPTRDPEWKLVNQALRGGFVGLPGKRVVRLVEEALRERLQDELEAVERPPKSMVEGFGPSLTELVTTVTAHQARFQEEATGEIRIEAFPPCMKAIWTGIQNHVNIPHMGRFAIVSFLHKQGMDSEAILKFFSAVPDFDVNKSRYQIEHITGKIGGSTEYTPPNCSTMQTYGICPLEQRDHICHFRIKHPLSYYRVRLRELGPAKAVPTPAAEVKPANAG